jgi:hypothetical protein
MMYARGGERRDWSFEVYVGMDVCSFFLAFVSVCIWHAFLLMRWTDDRQTIIRAFFRLVGRECKPYIGLLAGIGKILL